MNPKDRFLKEQVEGLLNDVIQRAQNGGYRQFTTTIDTNEQVIFRVKSEVQPRITMKDGTYVMQDFTGGVGLIFVTVKEGARVTV